MSNKTQLQTNNTKYASLIETLRSKAVGGGNEDVTEETNAYTTKISQLETAVTALETELAGKASGGGSNLYLVTIDASQAMNDIWVYGVTASCEPYLETVSMGSTVETYSNGYIMIQLAGGIGMHPADGEALASGQTFIIWIKQNNARISVM